MKKKTKNTRVWIISVCAFAAILAWGVLAVRPLTPGEWLRDRKLKWDQHRLAGQCVRQLKWLESASAEDAARKDFQSRNYRFYSCFGTSWNTPGVDFIDYIACHKPAVRVQEIEGTRERALSVEHERLTDLAYRFAREYNGRMIDLLARNGLSRCAPGEQWGTAFSELSRAIGGESGSGGALGMPVAFDFSKPSFEIVLASRSALGAASAAACGCFSRNGVRRRVEFHVSESVRDKDRNRQIPVGSFYCENGKAVKIK
jgi:hypothetical protein